MANKTRTKFDGNWKGFMDMPLTAEMKEQCKRWDAGGLGYEEQWELLVREGYKLSVVWNEKTQAVITSATGQEGSGKNAGFTLSAHAKTIAQSLFVLLYKHQVLAEGDWSNFKQYQMEEDFG